MANVSRFIMGQPLAELPRPSVGTILDPAGRVIQRGHEVRKPPDSHNGVPDNRSMDMDNPYYRATERTVPPECLWIECLATAIGEALLVTDETGYLRAFDWADREARMRRLLRRHYGPIAPEPGAAPEGIRRALRDYFDGDLGRLRAIRWRTAGTPFQGAVWTALTTILPGETLSYGALAAKIGRPKSVRAVGLANGANPVSLVVPCHRVIGADGSLTGYGGGLERKRWLLRHEGAMFRDDLVADAFAA
jgi:methylated-DNA-[protein]-cysteine S-methyltransferase